MVPFESLGTVSYVHCIASMARFLAVSAQFTNRTDRQTPHDDGILGIGRAMHSIALQKVNISAGCV